MSSVTGQLTWLVKSDAGRGRLLGGQDPLSKKRDTERKVRRRERTARRIG